MSALLPNLLHFSRLLGTLGLDAQALRTLDVVRALDHVELGRKSDVYHALRCLLVHHARDLQMFDEAFRTFWRPPPKDWTTQDLQAIGEHRRSGAPRVETAASNDGNDRVGQSPPLIWERTATLTHSTAESLRQKDFAELTDEELGEARILLSRLQWDLGSRRTRRWKPGTGDALDLRRVLPANLRYGGELVDLPTRRRAQRRRRLVVICDVSGSMERYSRMLLHFLYCMTGTLLPVEVFLFATRLTRVTRYLAVGDAHDRGRTTVPTVAQRVPDFGGGTRIGDVLRELNIRWARRVLGHGSIVLLISDGWDRGDPTGLAAEMARLHRMSYRLVWLNPLLGSPDYRPLTRGMQAALPHIDDFLPVHNLDSLSQLADHLTTLVAGASPAPFRRR
jgi:uncharacterized protein with von Willebrand factor type A (vWA) domain